MHYALKAAEARLGKFSSTSVYVSPKLRKALCLPKFRPVSKKLWRKAETRLFSRPVEGFSEVYRLPGEKKVFCRVQRSSCGQKGMLVDVSPEVSTALKLRRRLDFDPLTKLHTRTAFARKVAAQIEKAPEKTGALLFADLDGLKTVNDIFGHGQGDAVLRKAGRAFAAMAGEKGLAARISGDEFAVFLHGFANAAEALAKMRPRIVAAQALFAASQRKGRTKATFSAGLAWYPEDGKTLKNLLRQADFAMYRAKNS